MPLRATATATPPVAEPSFDLLSRSALSVAKHARMRGQRCETTTVVANDPSLGSLLGPSSVVGGSFPLRSLDLTSSLFVTWTGRSGPPRHNGRVGASSWLLPSPPVGGATGSRMMSWAPALGIGEESESRELSLIAASRRS